MEHLRSIARGTRKLFGIKYHRITGRGDDKQPYDRTAAQNAAAQHAIHFLGQYREQICLRCRVNIWPRIRRSKSLSSLLRPGLRTAISLYGSIRVTPRFIPNSVRQPCGCVKSRDDMRQTARNAQTLATAYSNNSPVSFCWHNQVTGRF